MSDIAMEIAQRLAGAGDVGAEIKCVEITRSAWNEFVGQSIPPEHWSCCNPDCEHEDCERYRNAIDNPDDSTVFGFPVKVIPDQPRIRIVSEGAE